MSKKHWWIKVLNSGSFTIWSHSFQKQSLSKYMDSILLFCSLELGKLSSTGILKILISRPSISYMKDLPKYGIPFTLRTVKSFNQFLAHYFMSKTGNAKILWDINNASWIFLSLKKISLILEYLRPINKKDRFA